MRTLFLSLAFISLTNVAQADEPPLLKREFETPPYTKMLGYNFAMIALKAIPSPSEKLVNPNDLHRVRLGDEADDILKAAMIEALRDPYSAQFRRVRASANRDEGMVVACGEVNAKNGFGAYVGFTPFLAFFPNPSLDLEDVEPKTFIQSDWIEKQCNSIGLDR